VRARPPNHRADAPGRPVVFDVSSIDDSEMDLQAAALLACWSYGFGAVNVANALADAGLEPRRHYFVILDELWRALRAGKGIVDRVDALTRLNRQRGVGMAMITHTMSDLLALPTEADRMKARGFVERSGMVICGGLPTAEMPQLNAALPFSRAEQDLLTGWTAPPAFDTVAGKETEPPGRGDSEQPQPQAFGFPAASGVVGQGEHLHPGGDLYGEGDDGAPNLVRGEAVQRQVRQAGVLARPGSGPRRGPGGGAAARGRPAGYRVRRWWCWWRTLSPAGRRCR